MAKIKLINDVYMFDAENDTEAVPCKVWVETSKKSEKRPEGKPWIVLPKDNVTNRTYFSVDKFLDENVDGEVEVTVKTSAPRVLGTSGVKQAIVKYLNEDDAAEYTTLVNTALEAYKTAKGSSKAIKPENMNVEELEAYIQALKSGNKFKATIGPKSFIDMFNEDEYARYNDLLALAAENKANAPRAKRGPLTDSEKQVRAIKRQEKAITKAEALLAAMRASTTVEVETEDFDDEDIDEDIDE